MLAPRCAQSWPRARLSPSRCPARRRAGPRRFRAEVPPARPLASAHLPRLQRSQCFILTPSSGVVMLVPCVVRLPAPRTADAPGPAVPAPTRTNPDPEPGSVSVPVSSPPTWLHSPSGSSLRGRGARAAPRVPPVRSVRGGLPSLWLHPGSCQNRSPHGLHPGAPHGVSTGAGGNSHRVPPGPRPLRVNFRVGVSGALTKTLLEF